MENHFRLPHQQARRVLSSFSAAGKAVFVNHVRWIFFISWWKRDAKRKVEWCRAREKKNSRNEEIQTLLTSWKSWWYEYWTRKGAVRGGTATCANELCARTKAGAKQPLSRSVELEVCDALGLLGCEIRFVCGKNTFPGSQQSGSRREFFFRLHRHHLDHHCRLLLMLCVGNRVYQIHINQMFIFWLLFSLSPLSWWFCRKFVDSKQIQSTGVHTRDARGDTNALRRPFTGRKTNERWKIENCNLKWKMRCLSPLRPLTRWRCKQDQSLKKISCSYLIRVYYICYVWCLEHSQPSTQSAFFPFCWRNLISRHSPRVDAEWIWGEKKQPAISCRGEKKNKFAFPGLDSTHPAEEWQQRTALRTS